MNVIQKIIKNTMSLLIAQLVNTVLSLVLSIFIARLLGDVALGIYSFAIAFPTMFILFLDLGYSTLIIRDVARDKSLAEKYLNNIFTFKIVLIPFIFLSIVGTINIMGYPDYTKSVVYLFSIFLIFEALSDLFVVIFRAYEKMEYEAGIRIVNGLLRSLVALLIIFLGYGLIALGILFAFSGFLEMFTSLILCRNKFVKVKFSRNFSFIKKSLKIALPLGILYIFSYIFVKIDTVMLSVMKGDVVVGWYNAAYNLILGFTPLPNLFMMSLLPLLSKSYISSRESLQKTYEKSFKYLLFFGLPLSVGISLLSSNFILFFYGPQYINSIDALRILSWDIIIKFLYLCVGFILISTDKQNKVAILVVFSAFMNIILNLFLIPVYSLIGSSIATLITEFFLLIAYLVINTKNSFPLHLKKFLFQPIIACGFMAFFLYQFSEIQLLLKITLAIIIYFVILFIVKGFSKDDIFLFKKLLNKVRK